jgi:hypothetical protein
MFVGLMVCILSQRVGWFMICVLSHRIQFLLLMRRGILFISIELVYKDRKDLFYRPT